MKALLLFLSVLSLTQLENVSGSKRGPAMIDFTSSLRKFTAYLYNKVDEATVHTENIFFSPLSIAETMGMVMAGAQNKTRLQIVQALHIDATRYPQQNINNLFKKLYNKVFNMTRLHTESKVLMANRAFIEESCSVKKNYTRDLNDYFDAGTQQLDFGNPQSAADSINDWVSRKTDGMITDLIDSDGIDPLTRLILANALYFQANWKTKFQIGCYYEDCAFQTPSGPATVPFMFKSGVMYKKDRSTTQVLLPYDEDEAHMLIVMPHERAHEWLSQYGNLKRLFENYSPPEHESWLTSSRMEFFMPLFELEQTLDVKEILKTMNVRDVFDQNRANLSGISEESLHVGMFTHKAKITVDDKGTKAAAASAAAVTGRSSAPRPIVIDKPFFFAIYRREHILFSGRVYNPVAPASSSEQQENNGPKDFQ